MCRIVLAASTACSKSYRDVHRVLFTLCGFAKAGKKDSISLPSLQLEASEKGCKSGSNSVLIA